MAAESKATMTPGTGPLTDAARQAAAALLAGLASQPGGEPGGWVTRFAPSPTGYLHLGHLASCAIAQGLGRASGGKLLLRIEDHDASRCRQDYTDALLQDLAWSGFTFDNQDNPGAPLPDDFIQSRRQERYREILAGMTPGSVYACACSRTLQKARGCEMINGHLIYDNHCRPEAVSAPAADGGRDRGQTLRFVFREGAIGAIAEYGPCNHPGELIGHGDFPLRDRNSLWTYQWAVTCDDIDHGINLVIRGADIWHATKRYLALWQGLSGRPSPLFFHHPLVTDGNGRKISKSELAKPLRSWRAEGHSPESLLAKALHHIGWLREPQPLSLNSLTDMLRQTARQPAAAMQPGQGSS